jgi:multiple sugar transport system permease protein
MIRRKYLVPMFLGPGAVFILLFTVLPFFTMIEYSVFKSNYIAKDFVGFQNYIKTFTDPEYHKIIVSSFTYTGIVCFASVFIPLIVALLIYDLPKWIQNYTKFMLFVPSFTSGVIMTGVWKWIFQPRTGLLTYFVKLLGMEPKLWLTNRWVGILGLSVMCISGIMGVPLLIYMSSILSIPKECFDAARIDGANNFQIKFRIIIPLLGPSILMVVLITMMSGFFIMETILLMTGGGYGTANFMFNIFSEGINRQKVGLASARSFMLFAIILTMALTKRKLETMKK